MDNKHETNQKKKILGLLALWMFLIFFFSAISLYFFDPIKDQGGLAFSGQSEIDLQAQKIAEEKLRRQKEKEALWAPLEIEAQSAFVFVVDSGETLFEKNSEAILPLASMTKLMTSLVALESEAGDSVVLIDPRHLEQEGDQGLVAYERWLLKELSDFALITSSNDAAFALAETVGMKKAQTNNPALGQEKFIKMMNEKAGEIGLKQTVFINPTGLDENTFSGGSYGTAREMAYLLAFILKNRPDLTEQTRHSKKSFLSLTGFIHEASNTNPRVERVPGIMASKTGFTDLAGGNLILALTAGPGRTVIIAILNSSLEGRFSDAEKIVEKIFPKPSLTEKAEN